MVINIQEIRQRDSVMTSKIYDASKFAAVVRRAIAEGIVLLENNGNVLPLTKGTKIALFGRSQFNYYKSGTGSGGMVNTKYVTGVYEALKEDSRYCLNLELRGLYEEWIKDNPFDAGIGWAAEPWYQKEMQITKEIAAKAAEDSDVAIILIGRTAGEDQDNSNTRGSYLLTEDEEEMLQNVTEAFDKTVVLLNVGNIIDMKWVKKYNPSAVAYIWQGGQEGGNGVLDVLSGDVTPSGKLTDTIARDIEDYPSTANFGGDKFNVQQEDIYVGYRYFETFAPDKVIYPFGYGLSYTSFDIEFDSFIYGNGIARIAVIVTNKGQYKGQETLQLYVSKPQGLMGQPARELVAFAKTSELEPGDKQVIRFVVNDYMMSGYDDSGITGHRSCYVMEKGNYKLFIGSDVRDCYLAGEFNKNATEVIEELHEALAPVKAFKRMKPKPSINENGTYTVSYEDAPVAIGKRAEDIRLSELPTDIPVQEKGIKLKDVWSGEADMDDFIGQLSDEELICIVRGEGMSSPKVTPGCGGAFGGVTDALIGRGIPTACCTDGPSGIRMDSGKKAFAMPNGTCLACTWNMELTEEIYKWEGLELRKNKIDVLLGPGMNIHRNPLNGRNFEYFSEDPLVTGKNAAAQLRGMHKYNVTGTIKHFALNTQETGRHTVEHIASERAIREIYLKGYEIAVKEAGAAAVMTTYGSVNGFYTSSSYDLVTRILRQEWGFDGIVMTDWWAKGGYAGKGDATDMASIVKAQNDLYMVTSSAADNTNKDNLEEALRNGTITRGELQRNAANICKFIMNKPVFNRFIEIDNELDIQLAAEADDDDVEFDNIIDCRIDESGKASVNPDVINTGRNCSNTISVAFKERGDYKLKMTVRVNADSELAQVPMSIFRDKSLIQMATLTGADSEWRTIEVPLEGCAQTFFLKLYFAQDGMEIRDISFELTRSKEEEFRLMFARMGE